MKNSNNKTISILEPALSKVIRLAEFTKLRQRFVATVLILSTVFAVWTVDYNMSARRKTQLLSEWITTCRQSGSLMIYLYPTTWLNNMVTAKIQRSKSTLLNLSGLFPLASKLKSYMIRLNESGSPGYTHWFHMAWTYKIRSKRTGWAWAATHQDPQLLAATSFKSTKLSIGYLKSF